MGVGPVWSPDVMAGSCIAASRRMTLSHALALALVILALAMLIRELHDIGVL